jgi:thiol-disulfide isomerase/thioredoxin
MFGRVILPLILTVLFVSPVQSQITYSEAIELSAEDNKPIVVTVGAEWCPACEQIKAALVKAHNAGEIYFVYIDQTVNRSKFNSWIEYFKEWEASNNAVQRRSIPQTVVVRRVVKDDSVSWTLTRVVYGNNSLDHFLSQPQLNPYNG